MDLKIIVKEFGKYILGAVAYALLALSGTISFSWQSAGEKLLNPSGTIAQAVEDLSITPKSEIVNAVAEKKPELLRETIEEIKPDEPAK